MGPLLYPSTSLKVALKVQIEALEMLVKYWHDLACYESGEGPGYLYKDRCQQLEQQVEALEHAMKNMVSLEHADYMRTCEEKRSAELRQQLAEALKAARVAARGAK